jgi:hypothetical protein
LESPKSPQKNIDFDPRRNYRDYEEYPNVVNEPKVGTEPSDVFLLSASLLSPETEPKDGTEPSDVLLLPASLLSLVREVLGRLPVL